ncbi:hypothetical protein CHS0354_031225 [Potamilus streckersoni]|uniref:Uncharacterized protein n=1 Tax=Potamilus streckersoni TaxID=2493646 RepID=A0AAE0VJ29_9BIVA|nr:hypothetical protein CHS0354_031225 [Potamilus streckersoni]
MGDEGSAYWITQLVLKKVFDHEDSLCPIPFDTTIVSDITKKYFKSLLHCQGGLNVVCMGSVWKSWELLEKDISWFSLNCAGDRLE